MDRPAGGVRRVFDAGYYDRFYRDPGTRAVTPREQQRAARFVASYLAYIELPVRRILDVGCGLGGMLEALGEEFPRAKQVGVEYSEYLCERYGWERGSVIDFAARAPFDLVVCHDVIQYLDDPDCVRAIANLRRLTRGALYLGVLTTEDWRFNCDQSRTDDRVHLRGTAWYRRRLAKGFVAIGGGLYLARPAEVTLWSLDYPG